jgi:hypothetical protein
VQAQILAPLLVSDAEGDWRAAWVGFAPRVTVRRLEEVVDRALWQRDSDPETWEQRLRDDPEAVDALLASPETQDRQTCARPTEWLRRVSIRIRAPRDVTRLFRAVLCTVRLSMEAQQDRLPDEADAFDAMLDHALASWGVDDLWLRQKLRKRYPIIDRDGYRCAVPGCTSQRNLQAHHIRFRSAQGSDAPENQTTLCAFHHQRGVHGGTLRISGRAPNELWFELGTRQGHPPLARYRSGDRVA